MIVEDDGGFRLDSPEATARLGATIARALEVGEAVLLWGPLGAGKSTLARGLVRALTSPDEEVPSPTFTLVQTYAAPAFQLAHLDLYRLERPEEVDELGWDELLASGAVVVEWPERLGGHLPPDRLDVHLEAVEGEPETTRRARLEPHGAWESRALEF